MKKVLKRIKNNMGFTLIETITALAILGLIVIPVGNMFIHSLKSTISSKTQLKANQLAQKCIEELKAMPYEDIKFILGEDLKATTQMDMDGETFTVTRELVSENYLAVTPNALPRDDEYDYILKLEEVSGEVQINSVEDSSWSKIMNITGMNPIEDKKIKITYSPTVQVNFKNNNNQYTHTPLSPYYRIKLECLGAEQPPGGTLINIQLVNQQNNKIEVYVVSSLDATKQVQVNTLEGETDVFYNINPGGGNVSEWVYKIIVTVEKNSNQIVQLTGTKARE